MNSGSFLRSAVNNQLKIVPVEKMHAEIDVMETNGVSGGVFRIVNLFFQFLKLLGRYTDAVIFYGENAATLVYDSIYFQMIIRAILI